jgi:hypothetical protein
MGASLEEAQAAMKILATPYATVTHPARSTRINSIASGWELSGGTITEKDQHKEQVLPSTSILARLEFNNAPGKDYFITTRLNIVKVENEELSLLGRLSKSGDQSYPFIITGSEGYRLYISSGGQIVNAKGNVIGKVTKG